MNEESLRCMKKQKANLIRIRDAGILYEVDKEEYIKSKHEQMVSFGYTDLTIDHVREQLDACLAGKEFGKGLDIIGSWIKRDVVD